MNQIARQAREPELIQLPVPAELLHPYSAALDAVDACPWHDDEWVQACQAAARHEIALFEAIAFTPYYDRNASPGRRTPPATHCQRARCSRSQGRHSTCVGRPASPPPIHGSGPTSLRLASGATSTSTASWTPSIECGRTRSRSRLRSASSSSDRRGCAWGCDRDAQVKPTFGQVVLELCNDCYRPLTSIRLLDIAYRGESTFFGNQYLIERLGPRAPELRAHLADLSRRIRERAVARGNPAALEPSAQLRLGASLHDA